jgi:hypothetical protein
MLKFYTPRVGKEPKASPTLQPQAAGRNFRQTRELRVT